MSESGAKVPGFGDRVRVRGNALTEQFAIAGLVGQVYGETMPSQTGVQVTGPCDGDFALEVRFEGRNEGVWLSPENLEFVDHSPGTEARIGGKRLVRSASGDWEQV